MPRYEKYEGGRLVDAVIPEPGKYDDTRVGLLVLERQESGARDGWYLDGEWATAEELRQNAGYDAQTVEELREALRKRDLPTSGNKAELVMRLQAADLEAASTDSTDDEPQEG